MRQRIAILASVFVFACNGVHSRDDLGEPLFVVTGQMQGAALPAAEGEHRGQFGWLSFGGGPYVECVEQMSFLLCGQMPKYETKLTLFGTRVDAVFPSGVEVPFWTYPAEDLLLEYKGAKIAVGGVGIYDDRNRNGELDPIDPNDTMPTDRVLAESVVTALRSVVVFREGPLHPLWAIMRDGFGCPDPPLGYSVVRVDTQPLHCAVSKTTPLLVSTSDDAATDRLLCGAALNNLDLVKVSEEPPAMLPPNVAGVTCQPVMRRMKFYLDEGHYCDQFRDRFYSLQGCDPNDMNHCWDLRDSPPAWWPCR